MITCLVIGLRLVVVLTLSGMIADPMLVAVIQRLGMIIGMVMGLVLVVVTTLLA